MKKDKGEKMKKINNDELSQHKERMERIEKMKVKIIENNFYGSKEELDEKLFFEVAYNQALDDLIKSEQSLYENE